MIFIQLLLNLETKGKVSKNFFLILLFIFELKAFT
jgi:hypothetical protein